MAAWLAWVVGIVAIALESTLLGLFGVEGWSLHSGLVVTMYLGLRREFTPGAISLAALLVPVEWYVSGPAGYYSLGLVVLFFMLRLVRGRIQSGWGFAQVLLGVVCAVIHTLVVALLVVVFGPNTTMAKAVFWSIIPSAAGVLLLTWPLGGLLWRMDEALDPRSGSGRLKTT